MGEQDMTQRGAHFQKKPITRVHNSIFDGHYRRITPAEVEAATRLINRLGGKDAPAILTMLGIGK